SSDFGATCFSPACAEDTPTASTASASAAGVRRILFELPQRRAIRSLLVRARASPASYSTIAQDVVAGIPRSGRPVPANARCCSLERVRLRGYGGEHDRARPDAQLFRE